MGSTVSASSRFVFDGRGRHAKHIGDDGVQRQVAHSESVLKAILFTGTHGHELAPIAGELAEDADILDGDVASGDQPHAEQVTDPLGILLVVLVALDGRNPLGIGNDNMDGKPYENSNYILMQCQ